MWWWSVALDIGGSSRVPIAGWAVWATLRHERRLSAESGLRSACCASGPGPMRLSQLWRRRAEMPAATGNARAWDEDDYAIWIDLTDRVEQIS